MTEKENEIIWEKAKKGEIPYELSSFDEIGLKIDALERELTATRKELADYFAFRDKPEDVIDPKDKKYAEMKKEDVGKMENKIIYLEKEKEKFQKIYEKFLPSKTELTDPER